MQANLLKFARVAATAAAVVAAGFIGHWLWVHYRVDPWTRDGRVRADVVQVAPDVSGLVTQVLVHDNAQVNAGDVLFVVDRPRYQLALTQANASRDNLRAQLAQLQREDRRNRALGDLVSSEVTEQSSARIEQINAGLAQANAAVDTARLNLARTEVKASVRGLVTNLELRPGSYASAGRPALALIDQGSLHVVGYFEETKISRIHVGDAVAVRLLGERQRFAGHIDSIAAGIDDRERNASSNLLANVNPTFNWVRLAQRIPVRVRLDSLPEGTQLIVGRTATVEVLPGNALALAKKGL